MIFHCKISGRLIGSFSVWWFRQPAGHRPPEAAYDILVSYFIDQLAPKTVNRQERLPVFSDREGGNRLALGDPLTRLASECAARY